MRTCLSNPVTRRGALIALGALVSVFVLLQLVPERVRTHP
jgi:hypothetical protein